VYVCNGLQDVLIHNGQIVPRKKTSSHLLLLAAGGKGALRAGGHSYAIDEGRMFLLGIGEWFEVEARHGGGCRLLLLDFDELESMPSWETERRFHKITGRFPQYGELQGKGVRELYDTMLRLKEAADQAHAASGNRHGILFQQLVGQLLAAGEPEERPLSSLEDIERTIAYMEEHFHENLERDKLAAIAGLSPWYYSGLFKRIKGCSPIAYLNEIRLRHAKKRLLDPHASIGEVARSCGYGDESYFRRKFKAETGITPGAFSRKSHERIAVLSNPYTAHLLALGIKPLAAPVEKGRELYRETYYSSVPVHLGRSCLEHGETEFSIWHANYKLLAAAGPSYILCDDGLLQMQYGLDLNHIAPCGSVPWLELNWRSHLRHIASLLRLEDRAESWLEGYEAKAAAARSQLQAAIGTQSVMLLRVAKDQLSVFGSRNVGAVLYGDLGLTCPYEWNEIQVEQVVDMDFVSACNPAFLLLASDSDAESVDCLKQLAASDKWRCLQAVANGRIVQVEPSPWLEYSPLAHDLIIEKMLAWIT
jgi:AraC-like DNA-binding protein